MVHATPARRPRLRLINPNSPLSNVTMPEVIRHMTFTRKALFAPTGLMICAAVTPRHWDVEVVDECVQDAPHQPRADVDLVGISVMTTQAPRAYALADAYRALGVPVVLGGIHPSALPSEALEHCDAVCRGDAESTLPHVISDFDAAVARGQPPARGLRPIYDWAAFPTAPIATPRHDVVNAADYLVAHPIQTTRGCPHACRFCTTPAVFGRQYRLRDVGDIVEEMRSVVAVRKPWCFIFADDNFAGNQKWALELCEAMKPLKIAWASQCDILIARNERLLTAMRASGCQGLILGLESPRQDTLTAAGKRFARSDSYVAAIRRIQAAGISLWGSFIFGFDTDTWRDCMAACRFAQRMNLAMSCYPVLTPYPGTEFFEQYAREGRLRTRDWQRYNGASVVFEPARMAPRELRHAQMAAFAEFFTPGSALRRLGVWPLKARAWVANLASWQGIRFYYRRKGRAVPRFRDFLDRDARAWRYPDEAWAAPRPEPADDGDAAALPPAVVAAGSPLVQMATALGAGATGRG